MPDRKDSNVVGEKRIEQELIEERPLYITALAAFMKAQPVDENDPASPWRHVDTIGQSLYTELFEGCPTLGKIWDEAAKLHDGLTCMGTRNVIEVSTERQADGRTFQKLILGQYEWQNYEDVDNMITNVTRGLSIIGIKKGQHVVIYSETRMEWLVSAIACFKSGLPIVTVYPTLGEEAIAYAMGECDGVLVFASRALLPKVLGSIKKCPGIKKIIYFSEIHTISETSEEASTEIKQQFKDDNRELYSFKTLQDLGNDFQHFSDCDVNKDDLAMIMYTSGTTGNPKGVLLSHRNIISAISGQSTVISVDNKDTYIGYLPLAHILEVCAELVCLAKGCRIGYSSPTTLYDRAMKIKKGSKGDCGELKPTLIACVPAIMDRIFKAVTDDVKERSPIQRELFRICYERKRNRYEEGYTSLVMNRLAFDRIRKILGGNLRFVLSGGAPLNAETQRFMNICFCCPVVQGYGLTETCGGASLADEHDLSTGSVGPPLRCCEIMLREWKEAGYSPYNTPPQGEILIHGDNVAKGYYKINENVDFIELNGKKWFATGDIGEFRSDGSLCIIDRKKDLIKLSHGEYISLGRVETSLLTNHNIENICVYGNSNYDYLIALVVPNQKNLESLAENNGIDAMPFDRLCESKEMCIVLQKELHEFVRDKLRREEIPKKVYICNEPWTPASGLLTEAFKLKRKNIEKKFEQKIKILYDDRSGVSK